MRPRKADLDREFRALERRPNGALRAKREALQSLDFVMVFLLGFETAAPWDFGSNHGYLPVRVHTTKPGNYKGLIKKLQAEQPRYKLVRYGHIWTGSDKHAKRLKDRLDTALLGSLADDNMHGTWKNIASPSETWDLLLIEAVRDIKAGGETIEFYSDAAVERAMKKKEFGGLHAG
jgi:hypothetical protein